MENKFLRNFLIGVGSTIVSIFLLVPAILVLLHFISYFLIDTGDFEFLYPYIGNIVNYTFGIILFLLSGLFLDQAIMNKCRILTMFCIVFIIGWVNLLILP